MISIIYTSPQRSQAKEIACFLTEKKNLTLNPNTDNTDNCFTLQSDSRIYQDSAVILVSDEAVRDRQWQACVRSVPHETRMIPVGGTEDADYSDPEVIPKRIEEINFIHMDENCYDNIWISLTTEKEYFDIKNMILFNMNTWIFSGHSEDFLLTDIKLIKKYLGRFRKKSETENNAYFREEQFRIIEYLKFSLHHAKGMRNRKIFQNIRRTMIVLMTAFAGFFLYLGARYIRLLRTTEVIVSSGVDRATVPLSAIKLVDGLLNPVNFGTPESATLFQLSEHLNMNWYNTPTGWDYKWPINDARIAMDERYFWSANENGAVIKWDTYTGRYVEQESVSTEPLNAIAFSEDESLFCVLDSEGYLFKKNNGGSWEQSKENYDLPFVVNTILECNEKEETAAAAGSNGKIFYFDIHSGIDLLWEGQYDEVFCIEVTAGGVEAVVREEDALYDLCVSKSGDVDKVKIPVVPSGSCSMDMLNGKLLMSDEDSQLITWEKEVPEKIVPAGVVLSRPLHVCFLNDETIVYQDADTGIHLYDLEQRLDLGTVLGETAAVSSLSASKNTVMALSVMDKACHTENVETLLPLKEIEEKDSYITFTEKEMYSDGIIRHVWIEDEYKICFVVQVNEEDRAYEIDSRSPFYRKAGNEDSDFYQDRPVDSMNRPMIVGILQNGYTLLVGFADGSFYETVFSGNGEYYYCSQLHIPSHAAVTAIYQTEDCYYVEDDTGRLWRARIGYDILSEESAVAAVKEKLHCAVSGNPYALFSKDTVEQLGLVSMPGNGKEVWE